MRPLVSTLATSLLALATWAPPAGAVSPLPNRSGPAEWVEVDGARIRLVLGSAMPDGRVDGALEIDLAPGFKTYWIAPGPAGIAPKLDAERSLNARLEEIAYPAPKLFDELYGWSAGYDADVAFPLRFRLPDPTRPATVRLDGFLGVCGEICIPVQVGLEQDVAVGMSTPAVLGRAIVAARDALPEVGDDSSIKVERGADALVLRGPALADAAEVFVAPPEGLTLDPATLEGGEARVPIVRGGTGGKAAIVVRDGAGTERSYRATLPARDDA